MSHNNCSGITWGRRGRSLVTLCETRFVERHDAIQLKFTLDALERIQKVTDRKAADTAQSLIRALTDSTLIVALSCAN